LTKTVFSSKLGTVVYSFITSGGEYRVSEIKRKKGESFEGFMRRVKRQWQQSGKLLQVKKIQFYAPTQSKNVKRKHAIKRAKMISKVTYLRKVGRLPMEEEDRFGQTRRPGSR
jgi:ribosomal protein S21